MKVMPHMRLILVKLSDVDDVSILDRIRGTLVMDNFAMECLLHPIMDT